MSKTVTRVTIETHDHFQTRVVSNSYAVHLFGVVGRNRSRSENEWMFESIRRTDPSYGVDGKTLIQKISEEIQLFGISRAQSFGAGKQPRLELLGGYGPGDVHTAYHFPTSYIINLLAQKSTIRLEML